MYNHLTDTEPRCELVNGGKSSKFGKKT